jgi:hypothetical protein
MYYNLLSWGSSVSIVSDYRMDDRGRSPAEVKYISPILCVQTRSEAHPASYPMGTGGPFPGGKALPSRDADHSPPSSAEVKNEKELFLLSSLAETTSQNCGHQRAYCSSPGDMWA